MTETAKAIAEMLAAWNTITEAAKREFPNATEEQIYQIAKGAMNHALSA